MTLPNPVPLGVAGTTTLPLKDYIARVGRPPQANSLLLTDAERIAYIAVRLQKALSTPLTAPGSERLAEQVLKYFGGLDLMMPFAEKILETLRDGQSHNRTALSAKEPRAGVLFVAWSGTHWEAMPERVGRYLGALISFGQRFGGQVAGLLEIDAFVRDNAEPSFPGRLLEEVFEIDIEYSYVPDFVLGYSGGQQSHLPRAIMLNPDLCSQEERQLLERWKTRKS